MNHYAIGKSSSIKLLVAAFALLALFILWLSQPVLYKYRTDGTKLNSFAAAERVARESIQLQLHKIIYGDRDRYTATAMTRLGLAYEDEGHYSEADPLLQDAVDKRANAVDRDLLDATFCGNLAELRAHQQRYADAEQLYLEDLHLNARTIGRRNSTILNKLASLCIAQKKYSDAEKICKEILRDWDVSYSNSSRRMIFATAMNNLATVYSAQQRYAEAITLYEQALRLCKLEEADPKCPPVREFAGIGRVSTVPLWNCTPSSNSVQSKLADMYALQKDRGK